MADVCGEEKNLARVNGDVVDSSLLDDLKDHGAFELVEELLHGIVMEVDALVGPPTTWTMESAAAKTSWLPREVSRGGRARRSRPGACQRG